MVSNDKSVRAFLDGIPDAKLKNFSSRERTLVKDRENGFRLDHQGVNSDGSKKDRLFIQPIGGKSKASNLPTSTVLAQVHVTDPGNVKEIRAKLWESYKDEARVKKMK